MIYTKKVPGKQVLLYSRKCIGNKGCLQPCKKGAIDIKNTRMAILKIQMRKKSFFHENLLDLTSFSQVLGFFLVFFSSDIFSSGLYFL